MTLHFYKFHGTGNDFILIDNRNPKIESLPPEQIKYQYEHPEKFLYREDEVLKSQILSQDEVDNVEAYLPMC